MQNYKIQNHLVVVTAEHLKVFDFNTATNVTETVAAKLSNVVYTQRGDYIRLTTNYKVLDKVIAYLTQETKTYAIILN